MAGSALPASQPGLTGAPKRGSRLLGTLGSNPWSFTSKSDIDPMNKITGFVKNSYLARVTWEHATMIADYLRSYSPSMNFKEAFEDVQTYFTFIGIGRSGTTMVGALLDAHPNVIVANQQNALRYFQAGFFRRKQIFYLLLENSRKAAMRGRRGGGGYSYAVPNQWQGRFKTLYAIGDKSMSAYAVSRLYAKPWVLQRVSNTSQAKVRLIHVIRNPYDTITTRSIRREVTVKKMIDEYFSIAQKTLRVIQQIEGETSMDVERIPFYLEQFIKNPKEHLRALCRHLGVEAPEDYLNDCASIIYKNPHKSRFDGKWSRDLIHMVKENIERFPYLKDYSYED
jgi:hypothetical protein